MNDIYLKAATEADLIAALPWARTVQPTAYDEEMQVIATEEVWATNGDGWALDVIGPVVTTPGTYDVDGNEITAPVIDQACHANLRTWGSFAETIPAEVVIPAPQTPKRIWA